ncbi:MAG: hypothetical protein ABWY96_10480 [Gaiellaceae bacterium]
MAVATVLDVLDPGRALWTAIAWLGAAAIALALGLPAVWWEPLHADEMVTQAFARGGSPDEIVQGVFVDRGGAPLHFLVEWATLAWPDGLVGLRVPSIVFFLLALPAAGLVARLLVDARAAVLLPLALACAPLAVELSTFGRMYSLLLAATLWSTALALWAARRGGLLAWTLCGVGAGLLVYIHPVAALYSALVVVTGLLCAPAPFGRLLRTAWAAPVALAAVQVPFYVFALEKLSNRYGLELDAPRVQGVGEEGRSVAEQALVGLGPGELAGSFFALGLALGGLAWLGVVRPRAAVALSLWLVVPAAFFTFVPTETNWFQPRLLLPVLPFFLLLAVAGCLALATFGRAGAAAAAVVFAGLLAWQLADDARRLDELADLRLPTMAVEAEPQGPALVFASVGLNEEAGRPGRLLDEYVFLERPEAARAPEGDPEALAAFVAEGAEPATGVWIFGGMPAIPVSARGRLEALPGVEVVAVSPSVLVVRSIEPLPPRPLVELSAALREAWLQGMPDDREAERLLRQSRYALGAS